MNHLEIAWSGLSLRWNDTEKWFQCVREVPGCRRIEARATPVGTKWKGSLAFAESWVHSDPLDSPTAALDACRRIFLREVRLAFGGDE